MRKRVELQQHPEPNPQLRAQEQQRSRRRDGAAGERAVARARHAGVDVAIPQVVHSAPRAAQQHGAQREQHQQLRVRQRTGGRGQRNGPGAGRQQEQGARWRVKPRQLGKRHDPRGQRVVQPAAWRRVVGGGRLATRVAAGAGRR